MKKLFAVIALSLLTGACAHGNPVRPDMSGVRFECPQRKILVADFSGEKTVAVSYDGQPSIRLPQQRMASGFRYEDSRHTLIGKGTEIIWIQHGQRPITCFALKD